MKIKNFFKTGLSVTLITVLLASCSGGGKEPVQEASTPPPSPSAEATEPSKEPAEQKEDEPAASGTLSYPVEGSPKVTYWMALNSNVTANAPSMNDIPLVKELINQTGIDVEFIHPAQGQDVEAFNLLVASGDLPDIIETNWFIRYPGGPELAFKNNVIEPLNDNMETWAPDYTAFLAANPDVDRMVRTDDGNYPGFPFIRGSEDLMVFYGPYVRSDWMEELSLDTPTTIDDWYEMLTLFKNEKGATSPLTCLDKDLLLFDFGFLIGAWGVDKGFTLDDAGEVIYGPIQPEFKDFLTEMNKWYTDGLIDQNFYTNDRSAGETNLMNDRAGASVGYAGSGMGVFHKSIQELDSSKGFMGVPYPTLNEGERPKLGQKDFAFMSTYQMGAVTAKSENKEAAYALLNYGYTEEGNMLYNFGIEGESYNMVGDFPTYTDEIINPSEGKTMAQMLGLYVRSVYNGPFVQRQEYYDQYMQMDVQKDAVNLWKETDSAKYSVPPITPTQDESKEYNTIKTNMDTWLNEWSIGAITGKNSLDDFDSVFVAEMEKIGVQKATEIQNGALQRYYNR